MAILCLPGGERSADGLRNQLFDSDLRVKLAGTSECGCVGLPQISEMRPYRFARWARKFAEPLAGGPCPYPTYLAVPDSDWSVMRMPTSYWAAERQPPRMITDPVR